jgi:hypothetical protein
MLRLLRQHTVNEQVQVRLCHAPIFGEKTVDCLIAATCMEAAAELYHNDRDFEAIAKVKDLKIYQLYRNFKPPFFLARAISPDRWDVNRLSV